MPPHHEQKRMSKRKTDIINICVKKMEDEWFGVASDEQHVFGTSFGSSEEHVLQDLLCVIPFNAPFQVVSTPSALAERTLVTLKNIYDGKDVSDVYSVLAVDHLSAFSRKVLEATFSIPAGYVTSYGSLAKATGGSPRAVGHVMATNPFAPIVPCHRVVASDFTLGGYGGGLDVKLDLLAREKKEHKSERQILIDGKPLKIFPVEFVLSNLEKKK